MDPEFKNSVIKNFPAERDSFVEELAALSIGDTKGRGAAAMKTELIRMSNTISMWTLITDKSDAAFTCFPQKCQRLADIIPEVGDRITSHVIPVPLRKMFGMLAMVVGRLTLRSSTKEEEHVVKEAQRTELVQQGYKFRDPKDDNSDEIILRKLWVRIYMVNNECVCRQCLGLNSKVG